MERGWAPQDPQETKKPRIEEQEEEDNECIHLLRQTAASEIAASTYSHYISSTSDLHEALQYMLEFNASSLAVFDEDKEEYVGFLAVLDVAMMLVHSLRDQDLNPKVFEDMATLCATLSDLDHAEVMRVANISKRNPFQHVSGDVRLIEVVRVMVRLHAHIVVVDPVTPRPSSPDKQLGTLLTQKRVVRWVHEHLADMPSLSKMEVADILALRPTLKHVLSVNLHDTALSAFELMVQWRISGVPVLNDTNRVVGCLSVNDIKIVASSPRELFLLYEPVEKLLKTIAKKNDILVTPVVTATSDDSFGILVSKLVDNDVHRVVIVDGEKRIKGLVTLGTILEMMLAQ